MSQFQNDLREVVGTSYTVKVDKNLSKQERDELTAHVRRTIGDSNATILIVEPFLEPKFDFNFDLITPNAKEIKPTEGGSEAEVKRTVIYGDKWLVMQNRLLNAISNYPATFVSFFSFSSALSLSLAGSSFFEFPRASLA